MTQDRDPLSTRAGLSFGDRVVVEATDVTTAAGIAGRRGSVMGHTTPSFGYATGVIGETPDDVAVNVGFDDGGNAWLAPELVTFVDVNAGQEIRIGDKSLIRTASGDWVEATQEKRS